MTRNTMGTILRVNLTTGEITTQSAEPYRDWIGGIGVGEKILYDEVLPWVTPFDPANRLIVCTGALSGTICPGTGRIAAVTKSPMTMGIASGNSGGNFAPALRYAGFEYIVLEGRAWKPVYLFVKNGSAQLLDASELSGTDVFACNERLKERHGDRISTMCIGPAGERLVRFACITVDCHRVIGKCGFGAVMGSKNLKAIVADGEDGSVSVADPEDFFRRVDDLSHRIQDNPNLQNFLKVGTLNCVRGKYKTGGFSYRHGQDLHIPEAMVEEYDGFNVCAKYRTMQTSCAGCIVGCQNRHRIPDGPYAGLEMEGTPFNSVFNFGTKLDVTDYGFCIQATWLCNNLGMDMDAVAELVGWVMECYEKGLLTSRQVDGLEPTFGNQKAALELIERIAYRRGVGDILAEGVARASTILPPATEYYGIHIKGHDQYELMRSLIGYGLGVAVSTRGGSHVLGSPLCESGSFNDEEQALAFHKFGVHTFNQPLAYDGKPEIVKYYESLTRACSSVGLCLFVCDWQEIHLLDHDGIAGLFNSVQGTSLTGEELRHRMLALLNLEKVFNYAHAGFTRRDDQPKERLFREAAKSGPAKGAVLDHQKWDEMLDHYYQLHGWDVATGIPTEETLRFYGLEFAIPDLHRPAQAPGRAFRFDGPMPDPSTP